MVVGRVLTLLGVAAAAVSLLWSASASAQRAAAPVPRGNAQGLALLGRVRAAYRHVPAVQASARLGLEAERFTLLLRDGVATAEQFVGVGPGGITYLVARGSGPTYAREPGTSCWRRLTARNPQSLEDVGLPFPDSYRMLVKAPRRAGAFWLLPVVSEGRYPGEKTTFTMHIRANTMLLAAQTVQTGGHRVTEHVTVLRRRSRLATPTPAC